MHERQIVGCMPAAKGIKQIGKSVALMLLFLLLSATAITVSADSGSQVIYEGSAKRFVFISESEYSEKDLFSNFKSIMPGDTLTQEIRVSNAKDSGVKTKLYLRAETVDEAYRDFLSQLTLTVLTENETILAETPADQCGALAENICLGTFYAGADTTLNVILNVPEALENEYQNALGKIQWVFTAEEMPSEPTDPQVPQTMDNSGFPLLVLLLLVSASTAALIAVVNRQRRNGDL